MTRKLLAPLLSCALIPFPALAAATSGTPTSATPILGQMGAAFSGQPVSKVQLTGTATWHAGSLDDTGSATLTASASGSAQMQLSLAKKGELTESQGAIGPQRICQYTGSDAVAHTADALNCWKAAVWFLPAISLQPTWTPSGVGMADLGVAASAAGSFRHLQASLAFPNLPASLAARLAKESVTDIDLDPQSLLPISLAYTVHPDNGAQMVEIPIEVRFSDYRAVDGVEIPFLIQRYINGSLQLEITVSAAQIN